MSRSSTVSTVRGTKREMEARLSALRGQFGPKGVEATLFQEKRGQWRLSFWLTPERESIRRQNLALKRNGRPVFEPSESQRAILAALFGGAELIAREWGGRPAWGISGNARPRGADVLELLQHGLIRLQPGSDTIIPLRYALTPAGSRTVLRGLGGNE